MARFAAQEPTGTLVQELEVLVRTAVFEPANALVGHLLQGAADRLDAAYQPKPGQVRQGRVACQVKGLFGCFPLVRDYYYHAGKKQGHYPADAALGLEVGYTPALARILCLEGADESSYQKAELHLAEIGGISVSARQIQRVVQRIGSAAQAWQEREVRPEQCERTDAPVFYVSADGTGAPMRPEELEDARVNKPMARPRRGRCIWGASSRNTNLMTKASRCATGNPPPTCRAWTGSMSSVQCCVARRCAVGWERP